MKRAIVIAVSVVFLVLYLNYDALRSNGGEKAVSVEIVSEERLMEYISGKNRVEMAPELLFNGAEVSYDKGTDTVYIPQNMSEKYFKGSLETPGSDVQICFAGDEFFYKTAEAIREGHAFALYLIKSGEYDLCHIVFTGMPVMNITTRESVPGEEEETINYGTVQVYDQYHTSTQLQKTDCSYHIRGGSSTGYEKPNYKLELSDKKLSYLGMRKDDDWILNSLYDDAGLIHNKVSMEVWNQIAGYNETPNDNGITGEYLEVFIDNEYKGVYLLTERVDKKTLSLRKNDILYKCRADRIPEEHNYTNEDTDEMRPIFILKYPKEPGEEDWEPLKDWVNAFCKLQIGSYEEGESLLDMENAVDYNLFTLLSCGVDNMRKNVYLIAEYQSDGSYRFKKVPWDMNATWGNPWLDNSDCNYTMYDPAYIEDINTWCTDISSLYFYDETGMSELLKDRWKEFRETGLVTKERISGVVDDQLEYLHTSGAYDRNYERWPHGSEYWQDEYIYEYIDGRIDFLDSYFERLYSETLEPAVYNGIDYRDEFEVRFYWERNKATLSAIYPYDRQQLLEHYVLYGKPYGLHARRNADLTEDWEYIYGAKATGEGE